MDKERTLEDFMAIIPVIKEAVPMDLSIAICDLDKFVAYWPGENIDLHIKVNQLLHPDEPLTNAIRNNISLKAEVPADFYGFEFTGTATPLHDHEGHVIGGIAVQLRKQSELRDISDQIADSLSQANARLSRMASGSNDLAGFTHQLLALARATEEQVNKTDEVVSIVKAVGDQTNLLGLNASIEAAHAGDKGRGFGIVAGEIRKLSNETVSSTRVIQGILKEFREVTAEMGKSIDRINQVVEEQAESAQHMSSFIEEIQQMSERLNQFAKRL